MKHLIKTWLLMLCLFLGMTAHARPIGDTTLELFGGEARVMPLSVTRIVIGNGKVISVSTVANNQLLILAEAPGTSTLQLWLKDGTQQKMTVVVMETNMKHQLEDINRLLTSVDNVTARIAGNKIVLEGEMVSDTNQERVQAIQKMYPEQVVNFVGKVGWEKMIYLEVKVLELSTKGSRDLGVRWDSQINGPQSRCAGRRGQQFALPLCATGQCQRPRLHQCGFAKQSMATQGLRDAGVSDHVEDQSAGARWRCRSIGGADAEHP